MRCARELLIKGMVQGVGFRWTAKRIADGLDITGWVRNNPDGSVTLAIQGEEVDLDRMVERLDQAMGQYITGMDAKEARLDAGRDGFRIER